MPFDEIRKQAISQWEALQHSEQPRILVGTATCGRAAGALAVLEAIDKELSRLGIEATITQVGCIGLCYAEPLVDIIKPNRPRICYGSVTPEIISQLIQDYIVDDNPRPDLALGTIGEESIDGIPRLFELPVFKPQVRISLRNCGHIDPTDIKQYIANGGYSGLVKALAMTPEEVIEEVKKSGLRGRGGAGFPTGQKWEFCRRSPGKEKYLICNADEGDPGAFMDRALLESDTHAVLEGMLIGAYAIGATQGYIYCRAEYPLAIERLTIALAQMAGYGLLGDNILGSGFNLQIAIKELKRFAADHDTGLWKQNSKIAPPTGKRVAIVGSGPAGLTAAYYLAKLGHEVTVFEALPVAGGMMRVGIPSYRLPVEVLDREIKEIENVGVKIKTNSRVESLDELFEQGYNAIFASVGAHRGINMGIEGETTPGIVDGVDFLREVNLGKEVNIGDKVAVVGGGM